jgi:hypothetical protein
MIDIDPLTVLARKLPRRVVGLVMEWTTLRREELEENWPQARDLAPLSPIAPLE